MGRMKEVFIQMQEENYHGDPQEYLRMYAAQKQKREIEEQLEYERDKDPVLCPNCLTDGLLAKDDDLECPTCGYEFVQIDNTIRFK